jgi:hypothetical protein
MNKTKHSKMAPGIEAHTASSAAKQSNNYLHNKKEKS